MSAYALSLFALALLALFWNGLRSVIRLNAVLMAEPGGRVGLAAAALLPACVVLALMIGTQMMLRRAASAYDPLAGQDTYPLRLTQRVIANTVEQLALFAPALIALAAGAGPAAMPGIVSAGVVWAGARLMFWAGYARSPLMRAPGMAVTFVIGCATILAACWVWVG
jgi:hypothetical protein